MIVMIHHVCMSFLPSCDLWYLPQSDSKISFFISFDLIITFYKINIIMNDINEYTSPNSSLSLFHGLISFPSMKGNLFITASERTFWFQECVVVLERKWKGGRVWPVELGPACDSEESQIRFRSFPLRMNDGDFSRLWCSKFTRSVWT